RRKSAIAGRVGHNGAGERKDDSRRLNQNEYRKHLSRRIMYRDNRSVRELYHEYGFPLRASRGVDCQNDFEDVRIEVASLDVDVDFDFGLTRRLNQVLRPRRVL